MCSRGGKTCDEARVKHLLAYTYQAESKANPTFYISGQPRRYKPRSEGSHIGYQMWRLLWDSERWDGRCLASWPISSIMSIEFPANPGEGKDIAHLEGGLVGNWLRREEYKERGKKNEDRNRTAIRSNS